MRFGEVVGRVHWRKTAGLRGMGLIRPQKGTGSVETYSRNTSKGELKRQPRDKPGRVQTHKSLCLPCSSRPFHLNF